MTKALLRRLGQVSGPALMFRVLVLAIVPGLVLSYFAVQSSRNVDREKLENIAQRVLDEIDESDVLGGMILVGEMSAAWQEDVESLSLHLTSLIEGKADNSKSIGALDLSNPDPSRGLAAPIYKPGIDGRTHLVISVGNADLRDDSDAWPTSQFALGVAMALPERAERAARDLLLWVWLAYGCLLGAALFLYWHTNARYRSGLAEINAQLLQFAGGDTSQRILGTGGAPEIIALADRLNPILNRLDRLIAGMRLFADKSRHEMEHPIANARDTLDRACQGTEEASIAKASDYLNQALENIASIRRLLKLDAEAGAEPEVVPIDLSDLVVRSVEALELDLTTLDRMLEFKVEEDIIVAGDETLLRMLVDNLLRNATKYAPRAARIDVRLACTDTDIFSLSVANTGAFPKDIRENAFLPFTRSRDARLTTEGAGLGLALVDRIAERFGLSATLTPSDDIAEIVISGPILNNVEQDRAGA